MIPQGPSTDLFAISRAHFATFHCFGAAVTAIVITAFVVVVVIAVAVSLVLNVSARNRRLALVLWVDTLALQK